MTTPRPPARILVAVDSSPAALAAARVAVDVAERVSGCLLFVHVLTDGEIARAFESAGHDGDVGERRRKAAEALMRHVAAEARRAGVEAETATLQGQVAPVLLAEAQSWSADLVVIGRSATRGAGRPSVGALTQHVLEFCEQPVLVVPRPPSDHPAVVHPR